MTPLEIIEASRNNLNAVGDTFWSDNELYQTLYRVMNRVARRTRVIESTSTASSVIAQADYTGPSNTLELVRVTFDGIKLQRIDLRQYDALNPAGTANSGTPAYYLYYNDTVTLYPTPATVGTIKYWTIGFPSSVPTAASTITIPAQFHDVLTLGVTSEMCSKDLDHPQTMYWKNKFDLALAEMESHIRLRKRSDRFTVVKDESSYLSTELGII